MAAKKKTTTKGKKAGTVKAAKSVAKKTKAKAKKTVAPKRSAAKKTVTAKKKAKPAPKNIKKSAPAKKGTTKKPVKKAAKKATPSKGKPKSATASQKKKTSPKRVPAKKKVTAKKSAKKPAPKRATSKAKANTPPPVRPSPIHRPDATPKSARKGKPPKKLTKKECEQYRKLLLTLRDQVLDGIHFLTGDNLNRSQRDASGDLSGYSLHMADQGTDNYDREFALNLASSEQDILYEIDEAIRRIDAGTYGICEMSGEPIERARLKALPHARYSVAAQSEMERGQKRFRPFGPTLSHGGG